MCRPLYIWLAGVLYRILDDPLFNLLTFYHNHMPQRVAMIEESVPCVANDVNNLRAKLRDNNLASTPGKA